MRERDYRELGEPAARAYEALQRMWARERPVAEPEIHRYVITIECTEEVFEKVALMMRGHDMRRRSFHEEPVS